MAADQDAVGEGEGGGGWLGGELGGGSGGNGGSGGRGGSEVNRLRGGGAGGGGDGLGGACGGGGDGDVASSAGCEALSPCDSSGPFPPGPTSSTPPAAGASTEHAVTVDSRTVDSAGRSAHMVATALPTSAPAAGECTCTWTLVERSSPSVAARFTGSTAATTT